MDPIILASTSPRRQEILKSLNIPFIVSPADIDEDYPSTLEKDKIPEYLATKKVEAVIKRFNPEQKIAWVLGADTIVLHKGKVYGKPKDQEEAIQFLTEFQGLSHDVITSIALYNGEKDAITTCKSVNRVTFAPMSQKEILWYVDTGEWHGAAGGYRIQSLASCFIEKIEGTLSSVMGLPIFELYDMLKKQNYWIIN